MTNIFLLSLYFLYTALRFDIVANIKISKGHTLPITGRPEPRITDAPRPSQIAIQPSDFRYLRPRLLVSEGDLVKTGTPLIEDKDDTRVRFVSPGTGKVSSIHYGERRRILEVIVELSGEEQFEEAAALSPEDARKLDRSSIIKNLLSGGLWPAVRQRPFARIANPDDTPTAIFINGMPTEPFDANPNSFLVGMEDRFQLGIDLLSKLTDGKVHLCAGAGASAKALTQARNCERHQISGQYPAGLPAVQIYHVAPPAAEEVVWYLSTQDVVAIADLLTSGKFPTERIVSLAGPGAKERTYLRTRLGASVESLSANKVEDGEQRYISGGVLTGRKLAATGFLGIYDSMLFVLPEGRQREFLGFLRPGEDRYSSSRAFVSTLFPDSPHAMDTNKRGSLRNFVLSEAYEDICAVDIMPQFLAKSVLAGDIEETEQHGILDCAECGLCTFVCPSKIEVGAIIRQGIDDIVKENN
jgi:Na+-transporting NADH:ubiquinone oxidoreductase subunit A